MGERKIYFKILINFVYAIFLVLILFFIVPKLLAFFLPFVIGWLVSMIANPVVKFLEQRVKILRKHGSAIFIIIVIGAIVGLLYLFIALVLQEIKSLSDDLPNIFTEMEELLQTLSIRIHEMSSRLPIGIQNFVNQLLQNIQDNFTNANQEDQGFFTINWAGNMAKNIANVFLMIIVTILSAYFFIANREELLSTLRKLVPSTVEENWTMIYDNFKTAVGGYFKAQLKIMLVVTVILFVGFEILDVHYSFLLGIGIAFLDFLPVFGTGAILWPWALTELIMGNYMRAIGLIVIYLICQILKQVLQPKMVGDSIGISPLATLLFMFIGYRLYNVLGMILGVPVGMVIINLYRVGIFDKFIKGIKILLYNFNEYRKF